MKEPRCLCAQDRFGLPEVTGALLRGVRVSILKSPLLSPRYDTVTGR